MPLIYASIGEENIVKKVVGNQSFKKHLEDMGFSAGSRVTVISMTSGNLIVRIRETRLAISRETAQKIII